MDPQKRQEIAAKGGEASHGGKKQSASSRESGERGGSREQHQKAGRQSHKNS
jgi:general stress protein YciG